ncbi:952_t:CDS:2 [Diversispora eburnea]|uniref:952_t:CDS:1 n=1 Tax=Diversispora eburnea TaxID=1213867 RepID=A0A9N9BBK4_9GLOM|nr:952_t:CDS:2 [Diversispora eburnea]
MADAWPNVLGRVSAPAELLQFTPLSGPMLEKTLPNVLPERVSEPLRCTPLSGDVMDFDDVESILDAIKKKASTIYSTFDETVKRPEIKILLERIEKRVQKQTEYISILFVNSQGDTSQMDKRTVKSSSNVERAKKVPKLTR